MRAAVESSLANAWHSTGRIELVAAALALVYLFLAIRQQRACWLAAFLSSALYAWVLFESRLYMESALNGFYAAMAVYGYGQWTHGDDGADLRVSRWPLSRSIAALTAAAGLSLISWFFLRRYTPAAWPFVDSLVAWASVLATFLVARKIYENWHWWLAIDSISLCLYVNRGLYLTALLFGAYLVMIMFGMREWRRNLLLPADVPHALR